MSERSRVARRHAEGPVRARRGCRSAVVAGRGPAVRRLADPRRDRRPGIGGDLRRRRSNWYGPAVWRSDDLGETWTHSSEGLTYGDDGPKIPTVWNVTTGPDGRCTPASSRPGCSGAATAARPGSTSRASRTTRRAPNGSRAPAACASTRSSPTLPTRPGCGSASRPSARSRRPTAGESWEIRNKGVRADFYPGQVPRVRPVRPQARHGRRTAASTCTSRTTAACTAPSTAAASGRRSRAGLPSQFGFPMVAHPRDPKTVWTIPLSEPEEGRFMPEGHAAVWRTSDGGDTWARGDAGLPTEQRLPRRSSRGDGDRPARSGRGLLRDEHRPAVRQPRRGQLVGASSPTTCPPSGRSRPQSSTDRRWPTSGSRAPSCRCSRVPRAGSRPVAQRWPRSSRSRRPGPGHPQPPGRRGALDPAPHQRLRRRRAGDARDGGAGRCRRPRDPGRLRWRSAGVRGSKPRGQAS